MSWLKDLIDTTKYRRKCNTYKLKLENLDEEIKKAKLLKLEELISYKSKYEKMEKELKKYKEELEELKSANT